MTLISKIIPGFKTSCIFVGILNITFFLLMLSQGIMKSMREFQVPEVTLISPHYADAMFWVFLHMAVIGILISIIGFMVEAPEKQRIVSIVLVAIFCIYAFLDISTSDNQFGSALYKGPRSVFPVFIDIFYILMFLRLSFFPSRKIIIKSSNPINNF